MDQEEAAMSIQVGIGAAMFTMAKVCDQKDIDSLFEVEIDAIKEKTQIHPAKVDAFLEEMKENLMVMHKGFNKLKASRGIDDNKNKA